MVAKRKNIFDSLVGFVVNYLEILMKPQKSGDATSTTSDTACQIIIAFFIQNTNIFNRA